MVNSDLEEKKQPRIEFREYIEGERERKEMGD